MGVLAIGGGHFGSRPGLGLDARPLPPEHHHPIHHDSSNIGAVSGGGAASRSAGRTEMVGTGGARLRGSEVGRECVGGVGRGRGTGLYMDKGRGGGGGSEENDGRGGKDEIIMRTGKCSN